MPTISVNSSSFTGAANTRTLIEATPPLSLGLTNAPRGAFRRMRTFDGGLDGPYDFTAQYLAKFGRLTANRRVWVRCTTITSDGQRSAPITSSAVIS